MPSEPDLPEIPGQTACGTVAMFSFHSGEKNTSLGNCERVVGFFGISVQETNS